MAKQRYAVHGHHCVCTLSARTTCLILLTCLTEPPKYLLAARLHSRLPVTQHCKPVTLRNRFVNLGSPAGKQPFQAKELCVILEELCGDVKGFLYSDSSFYLDRCGDEIIR